MGTGLHKCDAPSALASGRIELSTRSEFREASLPGCRAQPPQGGTTSSRCRDWITRRDYLGHPLLLREIFSVQSGDKRGVPLLCTRTKCVIGRIWRYVIFGPNVHELRLFSEQIDDSPNEVSSNPES